MTDPSRIVADFIAAVESGDVDRAATFLAEDVSYENVPIDPISGRAAVAQALASFLRPALEVEWRIDRTIVDGSVVVNERLDRFRLAGGWLELPVAGFFEVGDDGLIRLWRDYFDMATYTRQLTALSTTT